MPSHSPKSASLRGALVFTLFLAGAAGQTHSDTIGAGGQVPPSLLPAALPPHGDCSRLGAFVPPLQGGETFTYQIKWLGFRIGKAELRISEPFEYRGKTAFRITAEARIKKRLERYESIVDPLGGGTLFYSYESHRGDKDKKTELSFDASKESLHVKKEKTGRALREEDLAFLPCTTDMVSLLLRLRGGSFSDSEKPSFLIHDGSGYYRVHVPLMGRSRVKTPEGKRVEAWRVRPLVEAEDHAKKPSSDLSGLELWYSDDAQRLLLRLRSKVGFGSVVFKLVEHQAPVG